MLSLYTICTQSQIICVTAKQKRDDISALSSALSLQFNSYYFDILSCFSPIPVWNKALFKLDLRLMMINNWSQYYTRYRQRHIAEYSEAALTYRENNRDEINARHRNARREKADLFSVVVVFISVKLKLVLVVYYGLA